MANARQFMAARTAAWENLSDGELWVPPTRSISTDLSSDLTTETIDAWFFNANHLGGIYSRGDHCVFDSNSVTVVFGSTINMPCRLVKVKRNTNYVLSMIIEGGDIGSNFRIATYENASGISLTRVSSFAPTFKKDGERSTYRFNSGNFEYLFLNFYMTHAGMRASDISLKVDDGAS